jgi:hypothetical protein
MIYMHVLGFIFAVAEVDEVVLLLGLDAVGREVGLLAFTVLSRGILIPSLLLPSFHLPPHLISSSTPPQFSPPTVSNPALYIYFPPQS